MKRSVLLPAAYLFDQIAGDPEWFPHPVRVIGSTISHGESAIRHPNQSNAVEFASGALLTVAVVASSYWLTAAIIQTARKCSTPLGDVAEVSLAWTCLATRNLEQEATSVTNALHSGNLPLARARLSRIVGRDTAHLDAHEISRAVIETVAESTSDGVIAPLFYMALGGVPLAMAYKAVNTLDSMIGHADSNYYYFGKAAARLDDVANYMPSRICAAAIVAASYFMAESDARTAWRIWQRDGTKHKSPNAGQPESAMAGALNVSLGGDNTYSGDLIPAQRMGQELSPPNPQKAVQSIRLMYTASLIGLTFGAVIAILIKPRKTS